MSTKGTRRRSARGARFLDDYLPYLLGHASHELNKDFDRFVKAAGLTPLEWRVLATLADGDGLNIGQLSQKVVAQQPTLTKTIKKLHHAGLVRRGDDSTDLRKTPVFSTAAGRAVAQRLIDAAREHETDLLRNVSAADIAALKAMLRAVVIRSFPRPPQGVRAAMGLAKRAA